MRARGARAKDVTSKFARRLLQTQLAFSLDRDAWLVTGPEPLSLLDGLPEEQTRRTSSLSR